jgi:hypothetical protein
MTRQEANLKLADILKEMIQNNPDIRFSQVLYAFGFIKPNRPTIDAGDYWQNEFYTEPTEVLERVIARIEKYHD